MYDACDAFPSNPPSPYLPASLRGKIRERLRRFMHAPIEPLPVFRTQHQLHHAWRVDPHTITPWVIAHASKLPSHEQQTRLESHLADTSPCGAFLLWIISDTGDEKLIIHLGSAQERWEHHSNSHRPLPHLRELEDALNEDLPHPLRLAHAAALLARKDVTHRFYRQIQTSVKNIANAWTSAQDIPSDARHELALILVSRLMFLHFVQSKNWLPHADYLAEIAHRTTESTYREYWQPLFFDALNLAPDARISGVIPKEIPYLNGGLFARSATEEKYPDLDLPNHVLRTLILDVFQRYAFVDDEHEGHPHAIAPQLLGEIFERLMCAEERQVTGAFYTPHTLALELWQNTLRTFLNDTIGPELTQKLLRRQDLTSDQAQKIFTILWNLRVLDPAAGTGAFLLAALVDLESHALHLLRHLPDRKLTRRELRERWVTHTLHGIDIQRNAVLLAELRLWLSVTAVSDNTPGAAIPLPNLEHRLRVGNALLSPVWNRISGQSLALQSAMQELSLALRDFPHQRGEARHRALQKLRTLEQTTLHQGLRDRLHELTNARNAQLCIQEAARKPRPPSAEERALQQSLSDAGAWQQTGLLDPKLHFADVMQDGGFDIIIGNPPWGQVSTLSAPVHKALRARYQVFQAHGGRQSSPDMSVAFFEAYLPLLSDHGRMAFLFPAKALRARWGASWRAWSQRHVVFETLEELSTHTNHGFHASVYPCVCVLRKRGTHEAATLHPTLRSARPPRALLPSGMRPLSTHFMARYGVKTGCNRAFLLSKAEDLPLALPTVRGKNIRPFSYTCNQKILFTHDISTGDVLQELPPSAEDHLRAFEVPLHTRSDLRGTMPWWTLFRVRKEGVGWRVVWRDVAQRLEAAVLPPLDQGGPVNLNSTYAVALESQDDAQALCAWLNADAVTEYLRPAAQRARNGYFRFDAGLVSSVPIPDALLEPSSDLHAQALALCASGKPPAPDVLARWNTCVTRIMTQK